MADARYGTANADVLIDIQDGVTNVPDATSLDFDEQYFDVTAPGGGVAAVTLVNPMTGPIGLGVAAALATMLAIGGNVTIASAAGAVHRRLYMPASTVTLSGSTNITTAAGFNRVEIEPAALSGTVTVTSAATVAIIGPPTISGGGSITNAYALWVQAGVTRLGGQLQTGNGTAGAPAWSLSSSPTTGVYRVSADVLGFSCATSPKMAIYSNIIQLKSDEQFGWSSGAIAATTDLILERNAAGILDLHNGTSTSAQFNVWNTRTSATVGEWIALRWVSNIALIGMLHGSASSRELRITYGNSNSGAFSAPSAITGSVELSIVNMTAAVANGRVNVGRGSNNTATSGVHPELALLESWIPSASSTLDAIGLYVSPTINYAGGGAGRAQLIRLAPTNTALPTGLNAAIVLSATASALGGIHWHNQTDETTNNEYAKAAFVSNEFVLASLASGSGSVRNIVLQVSNPAASAVVNLKAASTITGAVTDGYTAGLRLSPTYDAATAQTVTRHNYIDLVDAVLTGAGPAALTDACALRFNAALGTHKATTNTDKTANAKSGTIKVNVNGTLYHLQLYANA